MMVKYVYLFVIVSALMLSGCQLVAKKLYGYHPEKYVHYHNLQGHWVLEHGTCSQFCAFTIVNNEGTQHSYEINRYMILISDDKKKSDRPGVPFQRREDGKYVLTDDNGQDIIFEYEYYDDRLFGPDTAVYKRSEERIRL